MGWWGTGVFDGDDPREYLNHVIYRFEQEIEKVLAGNLPELATLLEFHAGPHALDCCLVPTLAIIVALHETLESEYLPALNTVRRWKEQCLRRFDESDDWDHPETKAERRAVIVRTFDSLSQFCLQRESWLKETGHSEAPLDR
jgi:hypothetical protein